MVIMVLSTWKKNSFLRQWSRRRPFLHTAANNAQFASPDKNSCLFTSLHRLYIYVFTSTPVSNFTRPLCEHSCSYNTVDIGKHFGVYLCGIYSVWEITKGSDTPNWGQRTSCDKYRLLCHVLSLLWGQKVALFTRWRHDEDSSWRPAGSYVLHLCVWAYVLNRSKSLWQAPSHSDSPDKPRPPTVGCVCEPS